MTQDRQKDRLQTIFSFFLGLMVAAFIGVGVNTFLPAPQQDYAKVNEKQTALYQQQAEIDKRRDAAGKLTTADQAEYDRITKQIQEADKEMQAENEKAQKATERWQRDTSIVLILFATLVMAVSLIRAEQLRVISNGLLLGGLFTMVYGTGWSIASGDDKARFIVITFALLATLTLGYLKFVRGRDAEGELTAATAPAAQPAATPPAEPPAAPPA